MHVRLFLLADGTLEETSEAGRLSVVLFAQYQYSRCLASSAATSSSVMKDFLPKPEWTHISEKSDLGEVAKK